MRVGVASTDGSGAAIVGAAVVGVGKEAVAVQADNTRLHPIRDIHTLVMSSLLLRLTGRDRVQKCSVYNARMRLRKHALLSLSKAPLAAVMVALVFATACGSLGPSKEQQ